MSFVLPVEYYLIKPHLPVRGQLVNISYVSYRQLVLNAPKEKLIKFLNQVFFPLLWLLACVDHRLGIQRNNLLKVKHYEIRDVI